MGGLTGADDAAGPVRISVGIRDEAMRRALASRRSELNSLKMRFFSEETG